MSKIKKFLSHYLPLPYRRAVGQNKEVLLKLTLLDERLNDIEFHLTSYVNRGG